MRISNSGEQPNSLRGSTKGWTNDPIYKWEVVHLVSLCLLRSLRGSLRAEIRDETIRTSFNELTPNDHERRLVKERDRDGWRFWIYQSCSYLPRLSLFQIKYIAVISRLFRARHWFQSSCYEAVSDQGPVWVQSEDKIPRASKSNFEVELLMSLVCLLP